MSVEFGAEAYTSHNTSSTHKNHFEERTDAIGNDITNLKRKKEIRFWLINGLSSGLQGMVLYAGWEEVKKVIEQLGDKISFQKILKELEPDSKKRKELEQMIEVDIDMQAERIGVDDLGGQYGDSDNFRRVSAFQKLKGGRSLSMFSLQNLAIQGEEVSSLLQGINSVDDDIFQAIEQLEAEIESDTMKYSGEIDTTIAEINGEMKRIEEEENTLIESTRQSIIGDIGKLYGDLGMKTEEAKTLTTKLGKILEEGIPAKIETIETRKQERLVPLAEGLKRLKSLQNFLK